MKTITINVSETVYRDFQKHAQRIDRKTSELIREAMQQYHEQKITGRPSVFNWSNPHTGKMLEPLTPEDDLLGEMLND